MALSYKAFSHALWTLLLVAAKFDNADSQQSQISTFSTQYVKKGDNFNLPCNISKFSGQKMFTLAWHYVPTGAPASLSTPITKDDQVIDESKYRVASDVGLADIVGPSGRYDLTLFNVTSEESGQYICKVQTLRGAMHSYIYPVFVGNPPLPVIYNCSQNALLTDFYLRVSENQSVSVWCFDQAGNPPAIVAWYAPDSDAPLATGNQSVELKLFNLSMSRNGTRFMCRASNHFQTVRQNMAILVEAKAAVIDWWPKDTAHTYPMRTETLKCRHRGSPIPSVQWFFKGREDEAFKPLSLQTSHKYVIKNEANFSLCVRNISRADIGSYRCVLTNKLFLTDYPIQSDHHDFTLTLAPLKPRLIIPDLNVFSNACFVNWTIMASNIDYYVLYARLVSPYDTQADQAAAPAKFPSLNAQDVADQARYDSEDRSTWKSDNFSHVVDGSVFQPTRHGWKLFEGSRLLTNLLPQTSYQVKLSACFMNSCSDSDRFEFRTKDETRPLRSIPFAVAIKQKQTDDALTLKGNAATSVLSRCSIAFLVMSALYLTQ